MSLYVTWPEYGWRFLNRPVWEVVLGEMDGIDAMDRVLSRHPADFASGPMGTIGAGWLRGKTLERQDTESVYFRCEGTGRRWRFDLAAHSLVEVDASGRPVDHPSHMGRLGPFVEPPATAAEAEAWFRERHAGASAAPSYAPETDRAVAKWGRDYFMVTCTLGPFVAVVYGLGFEPALVLLAERPAVFARLGELFLDHFASRYEWAARAGYDGGHVVESYVSADIISPDVYRRWIAPLHREMARMVHSKGLKADLYSPGQFIPFLPYVRGQGWDAIRIDDQCKGVELDIDEARRVLGPEQCLFGNMSAYALLRGDWDDVAARARYQHAAAGATGPFIISNGSGVCDGTDPAIVDRWLAYARALAGAGGARRTARR